MKKMLRAPIAFLLARLARAVLKKYHPTVIMVTGSVGKTSTKDAIAAVLGTHGYVRASEKSYNSEFGVPLTILGAANPWTSLPGWLRVLGEGYALITLPSVYPQTLVLEVGADRPGDLQRILRFATPDAVVVTQLPDMPVHVEAYATPAAVREEEFTPAYALSPGAPLIVSADEPYARTLARPLSAHVTTYGFAPDADVRVHDETVAVEEGRITGMRALITANKITFPITVVGSVGKPQLLAPAAAIAAAYALGMPLEDAQVGAAAYVPPAGRGRILRGRANTTLIDDSYNASPAAVREALVTLAAVKRALPGNRTIAILGDMLELGRYSQEEHIRIGKEVAAETDVLITVGERSKATAIAALAVGMHADSVHMYDHARDLVARMVSEPSLLNPHDTILIKGSQSMRMEHIVYGLLENTNDAQYLVRQDAAWSVR